MTRNPFVRIVFDRKFVIVAKLLSRHNVLLGVHNDPFGSTECNNLCVAVGITASVDEPRHVALFGSITDTGMVNPEHVVTPNFGLLVLYLAFLRHGVANKLSAVFHHHLTGGNVLVGKDTPGMNARPIKAQVLFTSSQGVQFHAGGTKGRHVLHEAALIGSGGTAFCLFCVGRSRVFLILVG